MCKNKDAIQIFRIFNSLFELATYRQYFKLIVPFSKKYTLGNTALLTKNSISTCTLVSIVFNMPLSVNKCALHLLRLRCAIKLIAACNPIPSLSWKFLTVFPDFLSPQFFCGFTCITVHMLQILLGYIPLAPVFTMIFTTISSNAANRYFSSLV